MTNPYADRIRGELLREWRVSLQWEVAALARKSNLSVAQILQLEGGGNALFYTPAIKESAARKVARLLGGDPDAVVRPLDDALTLDVSDVVQTLQPLPLPRSVPNRPSSVFYRQPGLVATPILMLIAIVSVSGWLQHKWQQGGSQQFWRETSRAVPPAAVEPPSTRPALATLGESSPLAQGVKADEDDTTDAQAAVATQVLAAAQSSPVVAGLCGKDEPRMVLVPIRPSKSGDMVYVVAQKDGAVCVVDAAGTSTVLALKMNEARSVYGRPPWRVHFEQPKQAQLYFQGVRLRLPETQVTTLALQEGSIAY
jgi:transcriptional regulator with XRE-family HTH domain